MYIYIYMYYYLTLSYYIFVFFQFDQHPPCVFGETKLYPDPCLGTDTISATCQTGQSLIKSPHFRPAFS